MLALSIRQPYAELILRGVKTIEYRSRATRIVGERFYIYAAKMPGPAEAWAQITAAPGDLPTGVIVGCAVIEKVTPREDGMFQWHLAEVERAKRVRKPKGHPQPVWFHPFPRPRK